MKRVYIFSITSIVACSLLAAAVALSPRKPAEEPGKEIGQPKEADMTDQDTGPADPRMATANTGFGFKLYAQIAGRDQRGNTFISPSSIAMALAMTYNGAEAETKQAMAGALGFDSMTLDEINRGFAALRAALTGADAKVRLEVANSLWGREGVRFKAGFLQRNKQFFGAEITNLDFNDAGSPSKINSWVKDKTNGKIDKIIDQIDPMAVLYLINAIYFKGAWADEFKKPETRDEPFKLAGGRQNVPMMHQSGSYRYLENESFQAVSLPYGAGRVSMYVFLPAERSSLGEFQRGLTAGSWDQWMTRFVKTPGDVGLPRFKIEFETSLNDALQALGMGVAFDPNRANFRGVADSTDNVYVSGVKHKTFCEVNEEGTEAAAVTSVEMVATSAMRPQKRFRMMVDRPFFFAIRDNQTGAVLFMGSVLDPR